MHRRIALSLSLAITTIVMFAMVAVGAQAGFFSEHSTAKAAQSVAGAPAADAGAYAAPADASAGDDPLVVTDYVYVDEAGAPTLVRAPRAASQPVTAASAAPSTASKAKAQAQAQPVAQAQAQPVAAAQTAEQPPEATKPAAATATQAAPESTATQPAAATSTAQPADTSAPAQPTAPPASSLPREIEFVGTVTAIDGSIVTFAHRGTLTEVRVTSHLSSLEIGARVHVHAILSGGVYVATELGGED